MSGLFLYFCFMTIEELHALFLEHQIISTDTRKITKNCLFFALKGENFNGNHFAQEALKTGASFSIIDEDEFNHSEKCILVSNVLDTLQNLATYHRHYCQAQIIALTGSNGKTTTKELINSVLSKKHKTVATKGNLNNHIGVPLTLLSIKKDTEIAIIEMGANHKKEIEFLCKIAQPDFGYITNFGKAHLEGFVGVEGVIQGKSELYEYLIANHKAVFLNADDPIQLEKLESYINKFGFSTENQQYSVIQFLGAHPFVRMNFENETINTQLIGSYNFTNCAAAILIGKYFNLSLNQIKEGIENYCPTNNRSQLINKNNHKIILDAYNANPTSMKAALENFESLKGDNKIAFLGDMFELGKTANEEHQNIAKIIDSLKLETVYFLGENFNKIETSHKTFESFHDLASHLKSHPIKEKSNILIKGSRGMALERILEIL